MKATQKLLGLVLAAAVTPGISAFGQSPSPVAAKPDNKPLVQLFNPGTQKISIDMKKSLYDEAAEAYVRKYQLKNQAFPDRVANISNYFLPTDKNNHDPEGFAVFSGMIDETIRKGKAESWTAFQLVVLMADTYLQDMDRQAQLNQPAKLGPAN